MKKFFKTASIYLLLLFLLAAAIFVLNIYYGQRIAQQLNFDLTMYLNKLNYQTEEVKFKVNPLLRKIEVEKLTLINPAEFKLTLESATINLSWKQLFNYLKYNEFQLDKNFKSYLKRLNYYNLISNYQINFKNVELNYQGDLDNVSPDKLENILNKDHNLSFKAENLAYNYPYYRDFALTKNSWDKLRSFNDFKFDLAYTSSNQQLNLQQFDLSNEIIRLMFNFTTKLDFNQTQQKFKFLDLTGNYDFLLAGKQLEFTANETFKQLQLGQLTTSGNLAVSYPEGKNNYLLNSLAYNFEANDVYFVLSDQLNDELNNFSFNLLDQSQNIEFQIDQLTASQDYSRPEGKGNFKLDSSLITAEAKTEYLYQNSQLYFSNLNLRYLPKNKLAEQLNYLLQLILNKRFRQDEDGYYIIDLWGELNNLQYQ